MAYRIVWARRAFQDLETIVSYIAQDSPAYASAVLKNIVSQTCVFGKLAQPRYKKRPVIQGRSALAPRVLREKEIHVISDAIAEVMADGPHTI
jgi:plasmid stabilization system protein ParE